MSATMWLAWLAMAGCVAVYGWVWQRAGEKGRRWLEWGLAALVAGISAASAALHEPWRDELHAWLQAREMGLGALWREMAYEGHFVPWYLLLWPLAHFGAPVWTMGLVSWALNALAVVWLARRSPLSGWEKAAAGMSCLFLYVNPVVSRCYVLAPLALFGVASLWGRRDERPVAFGLWVALLANTHAVLAGLAAALFGIYAWENVLRRADGKGWRECGRQWRGLAAMAAGGLAAAAQVAPGLWRSEVEAGDIAFGWLERMEFFAGACSSPMVAWVAMAGLAWLGAEAWRKDRGAFWVHAVGLGFMFAFGMCVYPAHIVNRALLWWPVALAVAWILAGKGEGKAKWRVAAVVAMGICLARPDMTWGDWKGEYDALPGVCRWIEERFGEGTEVWINGNDVCTEGAAAYLGRVMDWGTGERARPASWKKGRGIAEQPFAEGRKAVFGGHPEKGDFLALGSMTYWSGMSQRDAQGPGVEVWRMKRGTLNRWEGGTVLLRVWRWGREWCDFGMARYGAGDRKGAEEAWKRAVREDPAAWEAMNNLAWLCMDDGRTAEARGWIDGAMAFEEARANPGARDTEARVRKGERRGAGDE